MKKICFHMKLHLFNSIVQLLDVWEVMEAEEEDEYKTLQYFRSFFSVPTLKINAHPKEIIV